MTPELVAGCVRAAIAYRDMRGPDVAAATGINVATLRRIVSKTNPRGASPDELYAIAKATDVPLEWFVAGTWDDSQSFTTTAVDRTGWTVEERLDWCEAAMRYLLGWTTDRPPQQQSQGSGGRR